MKIRIKMNKNKLSKVFLSCLAAASVFTCGTTALANKISVNMPPKIYQRQTSNPISSGVTHEHIQKFTTQGWWNINVLRVNLNDPFTDVQGIFNKNGISSRDRVSSMVTNSGAVGGINGDFFFYDPVAGSLGTLINKGEIVSTRAEHAQKLPGIFIDALNNAKIDYLTRQTTATNLRTGDSISPSAVNSIIPDFSINIVLTSDWGEKSIGTKYHTDLVEVLVIDGKVADVRQGKPAVTIPENGYVLATRGIDAGKMMKFAVGDPIEFKINSNIDIKNTNFAIGGGGYILRNGELHNPDIVSGGNQPRTGIGITKDGKQLLLVTLDGRGGSFKGVTQGMFGAILKDLGAYNALNLDGGGSTTMAVRQLDEDKSKLVNTPSDGGERYVVNGVGVFANAPVEEVSYLKVSAIDNKMFLNTSRKIQAKGYDKHHNPVKIDPSNLTYHYEGDKGVLSGNNFKALAPGNAKIIVKHGQAQGELNLKILDSVSYINPNVPNLYIDKNSESVLTMFYGKNKDGIQLPIYPQDLNFEITNDIGKVENNTFYSNYNSGGAILTGKLGNGVVSFKVYVGNSEKSIHQLNSLENINFSAYPTSIIGSVGIDPDFKVGSSSIRLKYNFSQGSGTRAAYINFTNNGQEGLPLPGTPTKLSLWVKGDNSGSWLRGTVVDSKAKEHTIDFDKSINWTGWEYKTAALPSNISYPVKLTKIYLAETDPSKKTVSEISIDGLTGSYPPNLGDIKIPNPPTFKDELNVSKQKQANGYSFNVTIEPKGINKLAGYDALSTVKAKTRNNDFSIFLNGLSVDFVNSLKGNTLYDASGGYTSRDFKNGLFAHLKTTAKGIRPSDPKQWNNLFYSVNTTKHDNIFLLLDSPVWGGNGFSDTLEAELLHEYLSETKDKGKNVFVIHGGSSNTSILKDGIRYIELDTRPLKNAQDINKLSSVDFIVNGSEVTYKINSMFGK